MRTKLRRAPPPARNHRLETDDCDRLRTVKASPWCMFEGKRLGIKLPQNLRTVQYVTVQGTRLRMVLCPGEMLSCTP